MPVGWLIVGRSPSSSREMTKSSLKVERLTLRAQQRHAAVSGSAYSAAELHGSDAMQRGPPTSFMYFGWKHNIQLLSFLLHVVITVLSTIPRLEKEKEKKKYDKQNRSAGSA